MMLLHSSNFYLVDEHSIYEAGVDRVSGFRVPILILPRLSSQK
ncbi:unnamed protein product [Amoebophrya sp. A120]|nr:unnamed protein product [Amoebophrya sp. A120]|eukprot:GSA120T00021971001.1